MLALLGQDILALAVVDGVDSDAVVSAGKRSARYP
jgi:hypothetical protein